MERWFAVLIFSSLLACNEISSAVCKSDSHHATHRFDLLLDEFIKAASSVPMPSLVIGDQSIMTEFSVKYQIYVSNYINALIVDLNHQAVHGAERLAKAVRKVSRRLKRSIDSIGNNTKPSICLDKDLELLTNHLWIFLRLKPEDEEIECPTLPDLPKQPTQSQSTARNLTLSELFTNYTSGVLWVASNGFYGYITKMYLTGWREARAHYSTLQTQFRKKILHGSVQDACRRAVRRIIRRRNLVQRNVQLKTWKSFEDAADRIDAISHQ